MLDNEEIKIENVQIYPTRTRVELNDKATKILFNLTPDKFQQMIEQKTARKILEKKNHKKHGEIFTSYQIYTENGFTLLIVLDEFDRAVLAVCVSEWDADNRYITVPMILRGLTGKTRENHNGTIYKDQETAILQSIDKLMATQYDSDIVDAFEKLEYTDESGNVEKITKSPLLPCKRVERIVNGAKVDDIIYFYDESPLHKIADLKNQILRYPVELLDVPNQQNTKMNIMLKNYVMRRVVECKEHKMTPTITLDDVFTKCRIKDKSNDTKMNARATIEKLFEHLQAQKYIKSYEWRKKRNKFDAITFKF